MVRGCKKLPKKKEALVVHSTTGASLVLMKDKTFLMSALISLSFRQVPCVYLLSDILSGSLLALLLVVVFVEIETTGN